MAAILQHPVAQALALALVHFLWQGALIAAASYALTRAFGRTARLRYGIGVVTLAAMIAAPAITTTVILAGNQPAALVPVPVAPADQLKLPARTNDTGTAIATTSATSIADEAASAADTRTSMRPSAIVLGVWFVGVLTLSVRLLGGWLITRRLATRAIRPVAPELQALAQRVAGRLALDRIVRMFESSFVAVPVTVGWIKPVVLFPAAALTGLSTSQIEALVAHELAHVSRHDYLVNLLQSAVETLLFYHPAVWWVSKNLRAERELCCDDLAVGVCDRLVYATALTELAAMAMSPRLAMAATGGSLAHRVRRILVGGDQAQSGSAWLPALLAAMAISVVPVVLVQGSESVTPLPTKVSGDQQTGVPGGVPGGVPAGVAGGVPGGVAGGVADGVPGGVPGAQRAVTEYPKGVDYPESVAQERPVTASRQSAEEAKKREEALAELRQSEEMLAKMKMERAALDHQHEIQQAKLEMEAVMAQLELTKQNRERVGRMVAAGTVDQSQLTAVTAELAALERKIVASRDNLAYAEQVFKLDQQSEIQRVALEKLRRAVDETEMQAQAEVRPQTLSRPTQDTRLLQSTGVVTAAGVVARAADVFTVEIASEPDLPRAYLVAADGTIRIPIIGTLKVAGLTAKQVQELVTKWFSDHQMKSEVNVTLRRRTGSDAR